MSHPQKRKQPNNPDTNPSKNTKTNPHSLPSTHSRSTPSQNSPSAPPSHHSNLEISPPLNKKQRAISNPTQPTTLPDIKRGWEWWESIGNPRFVLSPMVGQSELPFRHLLRKHGAQLTYTPMIIANEYIADAKYRSSVFTWDNEERPLVVQLCATNVEDFLKAAKMIISTAKPDAIELNLGCPQSCAERGGYGSWMMEKQDVIYEILTNAVRTLPVPITAKVRVFSTKKDTFSYIDMLSKTGISLLTVHPRQRHHREEVLADWDVIEEIRKRVDVPVVLNGDIWGPSDLAMVMCTHPVEGYMCAQGALQMPAIFKTVSLFTEFNRPKRVAKDGVGGENELVLLGEKNDNLLTFQSTQTGPLSLPKQTNYYRRRKDLGTLIGRHSPSPIPSIDAILNEDDSNTVLKINQTKNNDKIAQKIEKIFSLIPSEILKKLTTIITSYPLTVQEKINFDSNPLNTKFMVTVLYLEAQIDLPKRQLQNAVEYLRLVEKYPVFHHSVIQRHLFFILFDQFNKHIDCYDLLYVAKTNDQFKDIIHLLHKKAASGIEFSGCAVDNYFKLNNKERNRRRDGTLAPPPWPVGGGGFNVASNAVKAKVKGSEPACSYVGKDVMEVAGKRINMSKFD
jgi:tRNA-dihydrouridine synthase